MTENSAIDENDIFLNHLRL
jgi:hypothetical protein